MMNQRGATIVESMICMLLLCLVLFGLLQVFQWTMAKMVCEYSSFYAAKARAVGFADTLSVKFARVAAIAASGQDTGSDKEPRQDTFRGANGVIDINGYQQQLAIRAQKYMISPDSSINYEYWLDFPTSGSTTPELQIDPGDKMAPTITAYVSVLNMPLLDTGVEMFVNGVQSVNIPAGTSQMYNHSLNYLDH